jgi:hypothetical protein
MARKSKPFSKMLNSVGPDRSFVHLNKFGLCNWVFRSMPPDSHGYSEGACIDKIEPETNTMFGILAHFDPSINDIKQLAKDGKDPIYWGSDHYTEKFGILTELRETILCFCAAINGEL